MQQVYSSNYCKLKIDLPFFSSNDVRFQTTNWAAILAAQGGDPQALEEFAQRYRPPLLAFVRKSGFSAGDSEDLVQEVFARVFDRGLLARADQTRGRLRSLLLGIVRNVMREAWERNKRTPHQLQNLEHVAVPEENFTQLWMLNLLERALRVLREEHPRRYDLVRAQTEDGLAYKEIAQRFEMTVDHVGVELHRAKKRLIALVKLDIADYSPSDEEFLKEVELFQKFSS